jgi:alanine racemase
MIETSWVNINLSALKHNLQEVRRYAPHSKLMAMAKADAYGHGLSACALIYEKYADAIGVARIEEAFTLRAAGISKPILLLGTLLNPEVVKLCRQNDIWITVHNNDGIAALRSYSQFDEASPDQNASLKPLSIWLKLNSGMNRLGLPEQAFREAHQQLSTMPCIGSITHMTHFASADSDPKRTQKQNDILAHTSESQGVFPKSSANSAAILRGIGTHLNWVRPGIMLYGADPLWNQKSEADTNLKPVSSLYSKVLCVNEVQKGETVGYSGLWQAERNSKIAMLGIGYGDGYPRHAKSGTPVFIQNQRCALVGRVSMDLIAVDVSDCPAAGAGDIAELWGENILANEVAECANTISYALFTGLSQRVPRIIIER